MLPAVWPAAGRPIPATRTVNTSGVRPPISRAHPHRSLRKTALVIRKPVVQGAGNVGKCPRFAHAEKELNDHQQSQAAEHIAAHRETDDSRERR